MKRVCEEEKDKIVDLYISGMSMKNICIALSLSVGSVYNTLLERKIDRRTHGGIYKIDESSVLSMYKSGVSSYAIANSFCTSPKTIINILDKNGVNRDNRYKNVSLNESYFSEIDSYDKAYFLGFLITDGCVNKDGSISICISEKDKEILYVFSNKINNCNKIRVTRRGEAVISFKSKKIISDLSKYGVVERKTGSVYLPIIKDELMPHLLRGLIDGDGWISTCKRTVGFCGNETIVTQVKKYLVKKLCVYNVKVIHSEINLWQVSWGSMADVKKICDYLYKDKKDCYLTRKYNNFMLIPR